MDVEFWQQRWKENRIGFHQNNISIYLQQYWPKLNLPQGLDVFVPLCGKSKDMHWLAQQGYNVLGIEVSSIAVDAFFAENDLNPKYTTESPFDFWSTGPIKLICGDFFRLKPSDLKDIKAVFDRAALIAFPTKMRRAYAQHMIQICLKQALLVTLEYDQETMQGPPFAVPESEVHSLYGDDFNISLLADIDILEESPKFKNAGLSWLQEKIYHLTPI